MIVDRDRGDGGDDGIGDYCFGDSGVGDGGDDGVGGGEDDEVLRGGIVGESGRTGD